MIDLFYYPTPNTRKIVMMLEEIGLPYRIVSVDITAGEQFTPAFSAISPNNRVPAIVDPDGPAGRPVAVFESGAILLYLAEKSGKLLPRDAERRLDALTWLFWQTSSQGPLVGQAVHFVSYAPRRGIDLPYAVERYRGEAERLYGVLDRRLDARDFIVDEFSIADIAAFPWCRVAKGHGIDIDAYPNVKRWVERIADRPSARVKPPVPTDAAGRPDAFVSDAAWKTLFARDSEAGRARAEATTKSGSGDS
ncbi:MAG: glutathione S-transferase N-terminal domain-containing protein [Alphaproteobacteria bacterium]